MYSVLLPVDTDVDRARAQASYTASLAPETRALEATVLSVRSPEEEGGGAFEDVEAAVVAADQLETAGLTVNREVREGEVAREILRAAGDAESRQIVTGGRRRSGTATVLLGSTVLDVFLSTERPVTITGPDMAAGGTDRHLLVPVDADRERARHQAEFVTTLPEAADTVSATVLVVFRHQDYKGAPEHTFEEIDAAVAAADRLEDAGIPVTREAVGGEVAPKILAAAEEHGASEVVMGGRKRSGVQKVLMGSTARDILSSADRPVTVTG